MALAAVLVIAASAFGYEAGQGQIKFRVTPGAGLRVFSKGEAHFVPFTEYALTRGPDEDGYETYTGDITEEKFPCAAGGRAADGTDSGFVKTARVFFLSFLSSLDANDGRTVTMDVERLDMSRREDNGFMSDNLYMNVNDAQHLVLAPGETFRLIPIRVWQAMEGVTENYFIEPDYTVEFLGGADAGIISCQWGGAPGLEYAELTGIKPGVAVIRVTYGPVMLISQDGGKITKKYFNPVDPRNAGIVVVTVTGGEKGTDIATNIGAREYDTFYFDKDTTDHAAYTFKPSGGAGVGARVEKISVRAHRPVHAGGQWGGGWESGTQNPDGSFTVKLYEGRNIVEVSSDAVSTGGAGEAKYHVLNAGGVTISVSKAEDVLEIRFSGIRTPLEKIAGIYNPGYPDTCRVRYETPGGEEVKSAGVQYNLWADNAISIKIFPTPTPEPGKVVLENGAIECAHLGDPLGAHRTRPGKEPVYPNMNAKNIEGVYGALPAIVIDGARPLETTKIPAAAAVTLVGLALWLWAWRYGRFRFTKK
jgi:hypothetical protein